MTKRINSLTELGLKYVNFSELPKFMPHFNPNEMEELGVYNSFPDLNFFNVSSDHTLYYESMEDWLTIDFLPKWEKLTGRDNFAPIQFYRWYTDLYLSPDKRGATEYNLLMVEWWRHALVFTAGANSNLAYSDNQKQTMLELGWNYNYPLNFNL